MFLPYIFLINPFMYVTTYIATDHEVIECKCATKCCEYQPFIIIYCHPYCKSCSYSHNGWNITIATVHSYF